MRRKRMMVALTAVACAVICAAAIWASWEPDGTPVCTEVEDQIKIEMTSDGAGGAFLVWQDARDDYDIYAQHVDDQGNMLWDADGIAICDTIRSQSSPKITTDGAGGAIIAWTDTRGSDSDVYAQRVNAVGDTLWQRNGVPVVTYSFSQSIQSIAADGVGGALIVWLDGRNGGTYPRDIYMQRIDSDGVRQWGLDGVAVCRATYNQAEATVVSDGAEGAIVCWEDGRVWQDYFLYAQRIDSLGVAQWDADGIAVADTSDAVNEPDMVSDGAGGAIMTWTDQRAVTENNVYAQRVDHDGNFVWQDQGVSVCLAPQNQRGPTITTDGANGAIITWADGRGGDLDIYARRVSAAGDTLWDVYGVAVCTANNVQDWPEITSDGFGGAIITWYDIRISNYDIYTQRVDADGNVLWPVDGALVCGYDSPQREPRIVPDGYGGAIIGWEDQRNWGVSDWDIYVGGAQANGDPKTPTFLSYYNAETNGDEVTINWRLSEIEDGAQFHVFRRELPDGKYTRAGEPVAQGNGLSYVFTDNSCEPGKTYRYRVDVSDNDGYRTLFETSSLTVPAAALTLEQNSPNPFNPSTSIRFYIPERSRVNLSVFDPAGRLVGPLVNGVCPAGWNDFEWNATDRDGRRLSSGVYLYRLKVGKQTITKKMIVLK